MAVSEEFREQWLECQDEYGKNIEDGDMPVIGIDEVDETISLPAVRFTAPFDPSGENVFSGYVHVPMTTFKRKIDNLEGGVVFDISAYNLTNGQPTPYFDLAGALGTNGANVPEPLRKGGMSVKFIQGTAQNPVNKYVQYRLMAQNFTTDVTQWQGVDDEPTAESKNLVESGGVWQIPKFLFAANCPFIKEMYLNQAGVDAGISNVHNVESDKITFSNSAGTAFVGITIPSENSGINKIYYFTGSQPDTSRVLGYTIIDWGAIPSQPTDVNTIFNTARNIHYSPSIEANFIQTNLQSLQDNTLGSDTATKDYSLLVNQGRDLNSNVFFQYPKNYKVEKVNQIRYKVLSGTVNFYKVTINGGTATFQLIETDTNDSGDGTIKVLPISEQTLAENEFIGISGTFYFGVDANAQGFTGGNVDISTGIVTSGSVIALGFDAEYSDALSTKVKNLQDEIKNIDISSYGATEGDVISNYDNIVVLASDGTGNFTTFTDAHAYCSNATNKYKTTLVIMPGIYDIPVNEGSGYVICYNIKGVGNPILKSYNEAGNVDIKTTFSPFMMDANTPNSHQSVSIEGVTVIGKNVRYCVHDELGGLQNISYTHVFKNCKFVHLTAPDSEWAVPRCIGGGLGNNGFVIIDNCEFQSEIATSVDYHTGFDGGAASSKVIIKDCILVNNTVSCTSTTYPSDTSVMIVKDCILHSEPIYTDAHNNQDFKLISKNNIIV
jgi:hypothetical protein